MTKTTTAITCKKLAVLTAILPGEPGLASFIGAEDDGSVDDNYSCKTPSFSQARCPSCCPSNSVKALKGNP